MRLAQPRAPASLQVEPMALMALVALNTYGSMLGDVRPARRRRPSMHHHGLRRCLCRQWRRIACDLAAIGFGPVRLAAATGRHFALLAIKPSSGSSAAAAGGPIDDRRGETAKEDTHLKTWESKQVD